MISSSLEKALFTASSRLIFVELLANSDRSQLQQYVMRVISGIIILIMYYKNTAFGAYMPINSNSAFTNTMESYNVSKVLNDQGTGSVNVENYIST